ncbi:MAG: hypothetical protein R3A49_13945 [Acidimicrobiia bacterium]
MARLEDQPGYESQAEDHCQAANREEKALRDLITEYTVTYGEPLIRHGEAEYAADALIRLSNRQLTK